MAHESWLRLVNRLRIEADKHGWETSVHKNIELVLIRNCVDAIITKSTFPCVELLSNVPKETSSFSVIWLF